MPIRFKFLLVALYGALFTLLATLKFLRFIIPWLRTVIGSWGVFGGLAAYGCAVMGTVLLIRHIHTAWSFDAPLKSDNLAMFEAFEGEEPFPAEFARSMEPIPSMHRLPTTRDTGDDTPEH